ncbi:hypothetical protein RhiirC2_788902 [Rhizophagus irregularis]|uniref:Uncharacterized protein n=1 Tax=Rhizophagus irregularis TaxID=588596 RepID=A0A2N1MP63_9GLOM|nr:hypothetical protein RhiirC2_788902 [Rhizophagus irregularis]
MTLTEQDWNHVFAPVIKLVKNWMKLPKNTLSSFILFHEECLSLDHPWKIHCINIITDLTIRLNSDSHAAISIHIIRLRDAQLKSLITDLIFDCDLHVMPWIKPQIQKNVSFNALVIGKALNISMAINPIDRSTWSVSGGKEPLLEFFKQYLLTKGKYLMTWKQYRRLALLPIQGRVAKCYHEIVHFFPSEWLSSTHQPNITILEDRLPISAQNSIISLPLVQNIWIHRWIDDDILKAQLMDIRNKLVERTLVEYYTDGSLRSSTPTSMGKQDSNLVYTDIDAAFCVNNEPALSVQANVSL